MNKIIVVLISADAEWNVTRNIIQDYSINLSPFGEWFQYNSEQFPEITEDIIFIHGGWGKVAAAASTQFAIDKWNPILLINIGTCGGIEGEVLKGDILLANETIIYDIYEQMGDSIEHIKQYSTIIDNSWIKKPFPIPVRQYLIISGDRDLFCNEIPNIKANYGAIAADWESGEIAWVAEKNHTQCLILRGVTDIVGENGGEAYNGNIDLFIKNTEIIMRKLLSSLPQWIMKYIFYKQSTI
jgi:adenosylhomocysteine nucleosidase